jgi:hypothetical protein
MVMARSHRRSHPGGMERRVKRESESGGKSLEAAGNVGVQSGVVVVPGLPCRRIPNSPYVLRWQSEAATPL